MTPVKQLLVEATLTTVMHLELSLGIHEEVEDTIQHAAQTWCHYIKGGGIHEHRRPFLTSLACVFLVSLADALFPILVLPLLPSRFHPKMEANPPARWVEQVISNKYLNPGKLIALLRKRFPPNNFTVSVSITIPPPLILMPFLFPSVRPDSVRHIWGGQGTTCPLRARLQIGSLRKAPGVSLPSDSFNPFL
ncbi:uncharacterized protein BJX67DRAFT_280844 [Aspergillus lucknowensis]|uniref:Uncharacterized protein n=1 Tax=Aspergillus lucknowensis TaxID=176173 RepID=A0ABR4M139_9EURO